MSESNVPLYPNVCRVRIVPASSTPQALLDIPVYENPIESLHLLFSLYLDFRNNPHFQDRFPENSAQDNAGGAFAAQGKAVGAEKRGAKYGGADVLEINSEEF